MKRLGFLSKLKAEGKLELIEPSEEVKISYLEKSSNSLKAANLLLKSGLLEESVSMAYYAMYHSLLALMFKCGIKCENHAGNILLLKELFNETKLHEIISKAKEERIDKQYYIDFKIISDDVEILISKAQEFTIKIKVLMDSLTNESIGEIMQKLKFI